MRTYEKYKDSGISWIGKVPEDWEVGRFKYSFKVRKGLTITKADLVDKGIPVISYGQVHSKDNPGTHLKESLFRYVPSKYLYSDKDSLVCKGDFIFADTSEDIEGCGNCVYVDKNMELFAGYHSIIAKSIRSNDCKFFSYLFLTDSWRKQIRTKVSGVKVFSITQDYLKNTTLIIPPYSEQQAIANYLDKKTAEIDKIIAEREKKIELLNELKSSIISRAVTKGINPHAKMKDSGIDWIGKVPEDWEIQKMNLICKVITDFVASGSFSDLKKNVTYIDSKDYAMLIRTADLSKKSNTMSHVYVSKDSYNFLSNSNLFGNEIILPNIGASIGDVYMVPKNMYKHMTLGPNSIMVKTKYCDFYYYNYFKSRSGRESLLMIGQAAAQGKFNKTQLRQMKVPVPALNEQKAIATFIKKRILKIDTLISTESTKITLLREYKQSLISEVVTGKRKVID